MTDILNEIYEVLTEDNYIMEKAKGHIKAYEYPEVKEMDDPRIIMDPIDSSTPADYADDNWMTYDYTVQIEVWSKNRKDTESIADRIRDLMWEDLGFYQQSGPKEYDSGIFRDARRYRGKLYRDEIN